MKRREYRRYKHGETFNLRWFVHLVRSLEKNKKRKKNAPVDRTAYRVRLSRVINDPRIKENSSMTPDASVSFYTGSHVRPLPLHFHCTPDLLRYGRPREAANRSVTERPTVLDVSCSAVVRPTVLRGSFSVREKLPLVIRDRDPYVIRLPSFFFNIFLINSQGL